MDKFKMYLVALLVKYRFVNVLAFIFLEYSIQLVGEV